MIKSLILSALLISIVDPALLYVIYTHAGGWAALLVFAVPIVIGNNLTLWLRSRQPSPAEAADPAAIFAEAMLTPAARLLLWYPGPITSLFGLILLIPPLRRLVVRFGMKRLFAGMSAQNPAAPGFVWSVGGGSSGASPFANMQRGFSQQSQSTGGLKRAEGRVVDESPPPPSPSLPPAG